MVCGAVTTALVDAEAVGVADAVFVAVLVAAAFVGVAVVAVDVGVAVVVALGVVVVAVVVAFDCCSAWAVCVTPATRPAVSTLAAAAVL